MNEAKLLKLLRRLAALVCQMGCMAFALLGVMFLASWIEGMRPAWEALLCTVACVHLAVGLYCFSEDIK